MFFGNKTPNRSLFLYQTPFLKHKPDIDLCEQFKYFDEHDQSETETMHQIMVAFARSNEIIDWDPTIQFHPTTDTGSWIFLTQFWNFRLLQTREGQNRLLSSLSNQGTLTPSTLIADLHIRLGMSCNETTLSKHITRTYHTLANIPAEENDIDMDDILGEIHVEYPYLWILPYLQTLLTNLIQINITTR